MTDQRDENSEQINEVVSDVVDASDESILESVLESNEEIEQIGKDVIVGKKEVRYEDGKNVISVIISAISVRINMPRGTVKALMSCFAVLLLAVVILAFNVLSSEKADDNSTVSNDEETSREYPANDEGKAVNTERAANVENYVIISPHYRYYLPDDFLDVWEPNDYYEENETFCAFEYCDNEYTIRSYLLDNNDKELADIVKGDLSQFDNMKFLDEQYIECRYGDILMIRFEATDEYGYYTAVTGFYWYDSDPKICCLEISADDWYDDGAEEEVFDSVFQVSSENNEVPSDAEEIWQEQQNEEAMNSLMEDAMQDYYEPEPDTDPLFN